MKKIVLIFILGLSSNFIFAQTNYFPIKHYTIQQIAFEPLNIVDIYQTSLLKPEPIDLSKAFTISAYSYDDLAIFCKLEVQMEKASGFPVKFRLGEVNYVEQLEGKPYSIFY